MKTGFRIGSLAQDAITGIRTIFCTPANTHYMTLESPVGIDYQVPAGKTFYMAGALFRTDTAGSGFVVGYGDVGVPSQVGAPANWKQMSTAIYTSPANISVPVNFFIAIPTGKYPCIKASGGFCHMHIFGVEL